MAALTPEQLDELKQLMQKRQHLLLEDIRDELIRSGDQHYIDLAGRVTDLGDESVADMLADMDAAIIDRQVKEVRELDATLKRLAKGNYGYCVDCGNEIGYERLLAYPTALRCIQCQSVREKTYAHEGNPTL